MQEVAIPILTLLLGWALANLDARRRDSQHAQRILNRVLADLLEVRNRIQATRALCEFLRDSSSMLPLEQKDFEDILKSFPQNLLWDPDIQARAEAALNELSAVRPISAYILRSSGLMGQVQLLLNVKNFETSHYLDALVGEIGKLCRQSLDVMIVGVAEAVGRKTKLEVIRILEQEDNSNHLRVMKSKVEAAVKSAVANAQERS